jgi:beta-lactamase regulating signal transducer with metallopeptidase domain/Tol biopolymer transport system component
MIMQDLSLLIEPWAEVWAASLWRAAWQGSIAVLAAWGIARSCTFLSPRIVCWVWRVTCLKLLLTLIWAQPVSLAVLPPRPAAAVAAAVNVESPTEAPSGSAPVELATVRLAPAIVPTDKATASVSIASLLMLAWGAGVCWRVTVSARQWMSLRRLRRSALPASNSLIHSLLDEEAARLIIRRRPGIGISPHADGPLLTGIWRPMVLLPTRIDTLFGEHELRIMLAHELAHLKRRDLAWNWLPTLANWLFYFHPLVWLMTRSWCESQEAACDELLIQRQVAKCADYGRLLVKLAQRLPQPRATLAAASVLGAYRTLELRILGLAQVKPRSSGRLLVAGVLLTLVAVSACVPWRLEARETEQPASAAGGAPEGPRLVADGRDEAAVQESPVLLPGKIYAQANLEFKNAAGASEEYRGMIAINPNTGDWEKIGDFGHNFQVSPDGSRYLYSKFRPDSLATGTHDVWLADAKGGTPVRIVEDAICPLWSPDGKEVLYFKGKSVKDAGWHGPSWILNLETMQARKIPVPETDEVDDWSRQGNWLVTVSDRHAPHGSGYQLYVMHPDGSGERRLTEGALNCYPKFSPDGKRIVYQRSTGLNSLWVVDIDGSNRKQVMIENADGTHAPEDASWSPDGKWLVAKVFDWKIEVDDKGKREKHLAAGEGNDRLAIVTPDGTYQLILELEGVLKLGWIEDAEWY